MMFSVAARTADACRTVTLNDVGTVASSTRIAQLTTAAARSKVQSSAR